VAFVNRFSFNPFIVKFFPKYWYPFLTRTFGADKALFLNMGYEEDPPMALPLVASEEPNRFCIQLYHRTATQTDRSGKRMLEVSCGHGGGAAYLMRTLGPASYTGLDLNPSAINFCRKRHHLSGLDFVRGNAESLPFADQSFDAVINVEASHGYPRFPRFLAEVARVLRPGGHFLYTDLRRCGSFTEWEMALAGARLRLLSQAVINAQVQRAFKKGSWTQDLISHRAPAFSRGLVRDAIGVRDSKFCDALQSGEFSYRVYYFAKD